MAATTTKTDAQIQATYQRVLGAAGMEKVIEVELDADERKLMDTSIRHVKELVEIVSTTFPELAYAPTA